MKKTASVVFLLLFMVGVSLQAQDLTITQGDLRVELRVDGGFHLYIRKKPNIASVLLTETTRDPAMQADSYAYRTGEWNGINGNEVRILNGIPLPPNHNSLVSSTVVNHPELGSAFHIYLPHILYYGYNVEGRRYGEVPVTDGTFLNIRAFALPFADYRGAYHDNPFVLEAKQDVPVEIPPEAPPEKPTGNYKPEVLKAFTEIADAGGGELVLSSGTGDVVDRIRGLLEKEKGKALDFVLCMDTTASMRPFIDAIRKQLIPVLSEVSLSYPSLRIGMVLFRDYNEEYLTRVIPFTNDLTRVRNSLNAIRVGGGGDIPEAVYEALYDGATKFPWESESKTMVLIGDAPPHPKPRRSITKEMVDKAVSERGITVHTLLIPR